VVEHPVVLITGALTGIGGRRLWLSQSKVAGSFPAGTMESGHSAEDGRMSRAQKMI
jgi:hypothetical protein